MSDRMGGGGAAPPLVEMHICATPLAVRRGLTQMMAGLGIVEREADLPATLELVMAEVLNNVVEHGYQEGRGRIELSVQPEAQGFRCQVVDFGAPLPVNIIPTTELPEDETGSPLEGGYGWFLISTLAREIRYHRAGGANCLRFLVAAG